MASCRQDTSTGTGGAGRADLSWRGFSAEVRPGGTEPPVYDFERVSLVSPWKAMTGRYTREGDVRDLLLGLDERFVVSRPGDAISLSFAAGAPGPAGIETTHLLFAHGYSKEMDINSASPYSSPAFTYLKQPGPRRQIG